MHYDREHEYMPKFTTPEEFVKAKIEMLEMDFLIELTDEEKAHLKRLKTEHAINAAVSSIIDRHWS